MATETAPENQVLLRVKGHAGTSRKFGAAHAEKLLKYPNSQWEKVGEADAPAEEEADEATPAGSRKRKSPAAPAETPAA